MSDKYHGWFKMKGIVFYSPEEAENFIDQLKKDYEGHITGLDLKRFFSEEARRKKKQFELKIGNGRNNRDSIKEYSIEGSGLRTWIWEFERRVRAAYDAHIIVCYAPKDGVTPMVDSGVTQENEKEHKRWFDEENEARYKSFIRGEFLSPTKFKEMQENGEKEFKNNIFTGPVKASANANNDRIGVFKGER